MPRWLLWSPLAALTAAFALFGLRAGWHVSALTESDVIGAAAERYVAGGAARTPEDCVATPAQQTPHWITITCTDALGARHGFHADRLGTLYPLPQRAGPDT